MGATLLGKTAGGINQVIPIYIFTLSLCALALSLGAHSVAFLSDGDSVRLGEFFTSFQSSKASSSINFPELFWAAYKTNMRYLVLMFVSGFIVIGAPFVAVVLGVKLFYIGFAMGSVYNLFGSGGFGLAFSGMFLQNFLSIPLFVAFAVICIRFSAGLFKSARKINTSDVSFEARAMSFSVLFFISALLLAIANFVECFAVTVLI